MNKWMGKALVIDENLTQRKTLSGYLSAHFECFDCANPEQALELIRDNTYALIITEIRFSGRMQEDFLTGIKEHQPGARILASTAFASPETVYAAQRGQADGLLVKPIQARTLYSKIDALFEFPVQPIRRSLPLLSELRITLVREGAFAILKLAGKVTGPACHTLRNMLCNLIRKGVRRIAMDLENVTHIDNTGLQLIHQVCHSLKILSGELCLFNIMKVLGRITEHLDVITNVRLFLDRDEFEAGALTVTGYRMAFPQSQR
ncbi:MAG: response regulator [Fibrobacterota bacterium]